MLQKFAYVFGILLIVVGVLSFIGATSVHGQLFRIFTTDVMGSMIYIATGATMLIAARHGVVRTKLYFKVFGLLYAIMAVFGFLEGDVVLGLMAVNAATSAFNLLVALAALAAGFGTKEGELRAGAAM